MPDPTFPRLGPNEQAHQLFGVNKALGHIHYAKLALVGFEWAVNAVAELETAEANITSYRERELVS